MSLSDTRRGKCGGFGQIGTLPLERTAFVGREAETIRLREQLADPTVRLLTLVGPGGVGKTRLALHVAALAEPSFADGATFVDLGSVQQPDLVALAVARALGLHESRGQTAEMALLRHLGDRSALLVLDNFEHLLPAAVIAATLLASCPSLKVLVTSRAALRLSGERVFVVRPLPTPTSFADCSVDALGQYAAVRLFVERARGVDPDFQLDREVAPAVAEICARLDGLPLAIELAAARLRLLSPLVLLGRLERRLPLLTGGPRDAPARHQTLRNTIACSYDLLHPAEQAIFLALAVFAGGCPLGVAEHLCLSALARAPDGGDERSPLDLVESLVEKSLIYRVDGTSGATRVNMLETIREFALERLAAGAERAMRRRHAEFVLELVEMAELALAGGPQQQTWLRRLDEEHVNIAGALKWALDAGEDDVALRIAAAAWRFWFNRGYLSAGRRWLDAVLACDGGDPAIRAKALCGAAVLASNQGDYATHRHDEALALFRQIDDQRGVGLVLNTLGMVALEQGDYEQGERRLTESLALHRQIGDSRGVAMALTNLGGAAVDRNAHGRAAALLSEAMLLIDQLGERQGRIWALIHLGRLARCQGDRPAARRRLEEALAIARSLSAKHEIATAATRLGHLELDERSFEAAERLFRESLSARAELGYAARIAAPLEGFAALASATGAHARAARLLGAAAALRAGGSPLSPLDRADRDRALDESQRALAPQCFTTSWREGCTMTDLRAIAYAFSREEVGPPPACPRMAVEGASPVSHPGFPLSSREREVACLVAQGLSNRAIAERLVVSPRTVVSHLEHIFQKLDIKSRTQLVLWAIERGLIETPASGAS